MRSRQIELRNVAGEVNPADLFTKQPISREKRMALTRLFDCEFRAGRPANVARTRATPGTKITTADVDWETQLIQEEYEAQEIMLSLDRPHMPHRAHSESSLNKCFGECLRGWLDDQERVAIVPCRRMSSCAS